LAPIFSSFQCSYFSLSPSFSSLGYSWRL
jgi:hypothetical protein